MNGLGGSRASGFTSLGVMREKGEGFAADDGAAIELYEKSCNGGDGWGCNLLGVRFLLGRNGVGPNASRASEPFTRACDHNYGHGCFNLGLMYSTADGVTHDPEKARVAFQKASRHQGRVQACRIQDGGRAAMTLEVHNFGRLGTTSAA